MSIVWPLTLPQKPQQQGFSRNRMSNLVRTEMDAGPVVSRMLGTSAPFIYNVNFNMDATQVDTFWSFFESTIYYGSEEFQWLDPVSGVEYYWKILVADGSPTETNLGGDEYNISFTLERGAAV